MITQELFINYERADLSPDQPIALTLQVNDLADLQDRQSTYSQTIKLPKTATNKRLLGYSDSDSFTQLQPYRNSLGKYAVNGSEIIPSGIITLQTVSDYFEVQLTCGLVFLSTLLTLVTTDIVTSIVTSRDLNITDLDYSDIAHFDFDLATIVASHGGTGVLWPIIDYGGTLDISSIIETTYLRPGIFMADIMNRLQKYLGYTFSGSVFSDSEYLNDFIPFSATILNDYEGTDWKVTGLPLSVAANIPSITVKDLLKDFMQRYFLTPIVDNYAKTVVFKSLDDLYANKGNAKDWTQKFIDDARSDEFTLPNYAQVNNLFWKADELYMTNGDGVITVDNQTLPANAALVTSIFAASGNVVAVAGLNIATIKKFPVSPLPDTGTPFSVDTQIRIVNIRKAPGSGYNFKYNGGSSTFSATAYYGTFHSSPNGGIGYQDQLKKYGTGLLNLLKKCRVITRYALLSPADLYNFDFFTPVYDAKEGKYYYCNQIVNYIPGNKTKVQLIRM